MNTKLTLRLDKGLIESAKKHARMRGKSVSQMVADYFLILDKKTVTKKTGLTPIVKSLKGALKNSNISEKDYKDYLKDKYL